MNENVEGIRERMVSLLVDSEALRRKARRIGNTSKAQQRPEIEALKEIADRIDRETRELYFLLPEGLRPTGVPHLQKPREARPVDERRQGQPPKPGGPIPSEVRWPNWTFEHILTLADEYKAKHGTWPNKNSGRVSDSSPDTWTGIDIALKRGNRNLPGGITLARFLAEKRGARNRVNTPMLDLATVLAWADSEFERSGKWPNSETGAVLEAPGETWCMISYALKRGSRNLPKTGSLARLLSRDRGVPNVHDQEPLTVGRILEWADAHHQRTGAWPTSTSGTIPEAPHENWKRINHALIQGNRTLPKGLSVARLLAKHRGTRNRSALPPLEVEAILKWADNHFNREGRWPTCWSGPILDAPGETWHAVDAGFKAGIRGLVNTGYRSLAHLLDERRGKLRRRGNRPAERFMEDAA